MVKNQMQSQCCAILFQISKREDNILLELLDQIIYEPCFNQLRNSEHLGYIVRTSVRRSNGTQGFLITIQGTLNPDMAHSRVLNFLSNFEVLNLTLFFGTFAKPLIKY